MKLQLREEFIKKDIKKDVFSRTQLLHSDETSCMKINTSVKYKNQARD